MDFDVRTSFVSFVDHLPSDIIRKLWLIQSLNIRHQSVRTQLDAHLKSLQSSDLSKQQFNSLIHRVTQLSEEALGIRREVCEESKSIATTIKIANFQLQNQYQQLEHDHKMYQNEMEMKEALVKHAKRTNKRTSSSHKSPKVVLKLNLKNAATPQKKTRRSKKIVVQSKERVRKPKKEVEQVVQEDEDDETYCVCRGPSFGDMVACDNPKCKLEWFHYGCVGLTRAPRGEWLCPTCRKKE
jgi:hypothetical protein